MFLSIREIFYNKSRYILISIIIFLIAYAVFILSGLSLGLSNQFKQAVVDWNAEKIVLSSSSNNIISASQISSQDLNDIKGGETSSLSLFSTSIRSSKDKRVNVSIIATPEDSVIKPQLLQGKTYKKDNLEIIVSKSLIDKGYKIGQKISVGDSNIQLKIVGFFKSSTYSAAPVIYTSFPILYKIENIKQASKAAPVNAVVIKSGKVTILNQNNNQLKIISISEFINDIPGYSAQNITLSAMIYFLFLIVLLIIGVFMYVITLQKIPIFGIMKAQGISNWVIMQSILGQAFFVSLIGVAASFAVSYLTSFILPSAMPFEISASNWMFYSVVLIVVSVIGSISSIFTIIKIDPTKVIGG
ncbi:ABC transporter permease [Lactovum miscens]|uniref:Putative hemin transport system permease protein HrtB n=1 Tax=Lactovum miscens TaxID=190387 RepID=A0A841CAM6_9LACT|nr:ABC transporter permease [Lactovum miscens]MBB5888240.1 putative ABC transport system permease protein [Lactovum miscens]